MTSKSAKILLAVAAGLLLAAGAQADQQELQVGYVFDAWNSNSLYHGTEHRVPLSYYFSSPDFSLSLNSAFVAGEYDQDANSSAGITGNSYSSSSFMDTSLGARLSLDMGNSVKSGFSGTLNFPTGNDNWEIAEQVGAVPFIFEPGYYRGAGWGGNFFYTLSASAPGAEYGLGLGYMATGTYDTGLSAQGLFSPGDNLVALATAGFEMSPADTLAFRYARTFPMESTYSNPANDFTLGPGNICSAQWMSKMGGDKLVINASYSFYGTGSTAQANAPYSLAANPGAYLGDRLELHPVLGYSAGSGVVLETGLVGDWIQPNGYPRPQGIISTPGYQGGGILLGAEQSLTFQLSQTTFWNLAGLYHFISNDNMGGNYDASVAYQRFSFGTNMGVKW